MRPSRAGGDRCGVMSPPQPPVLNPQIAAEHRSRLLEVALALTGSRPLAEDLTQETYARVLAKPRALREGAVFPYLVRALRNDRESPSPYVPIIMLTAYSNYEDVCATRDSGVTEYLVKPFSVRALADRILSVIDHPRPFVRSPDYFGPDRRRRADAGHAGPFRRAGDKKAAE